MATTIPACSSAHATLQPSQRIKITNTSGHQVIDLWAFPTSNTPCWMSMSQTRSKLMKIMPSVGDLLVDIDREPVLGILQDTSTGRHDTLFPACDAQRYAQLGLPNHGSCGQNLGIELTRYLEQTDEGCTGYAALSELESCSRRWAWTPEPFNLFMNVPWQGERGKLQVKPPDCKEADFVILYAMKECLVVMSACPNDVLDTNGGQPTSATFEVLSLD